MVPCPFLVLSTVKPVCKMSVRSKRIRTHPSKPCQGVPTWGAYGGGGQRLKHSIYKPNWSIYTHSDWPINWALMRSVNPNNETHPGRWWWIPCLFRKLSDKHFIYVDSKLRFRFKFTGNFQLEPKVYNNLQKRERISQKLFELFTNTCT